MVHKSAVINRQLLAWATVVFWPMVEGAIAPLASTSTWSLSYASRREVTLNAGHSVLVGVNARQECWTYHLSPSPRQDPSFCIKRDIGHHQRSQHSPRQASPRSPSNKQHCALGVSFPSSSSWNAPASGDTLSLGRAWSTSPLIITADQRRPRSKVPKHIPSRHILLDVALLLFACLRQETGVDFDRGAQAHRGSS